MNDEKGVAEFGLEGGSVLHVSCRCLEMRSRGKKLTVVLIPYLSSWSWLFVVVHRDDDGQGFVHVQTDMNPSIQR